MCISHFKSIRRTFDESRLLSLLRKSGIPRNQVIEEKDEFKKPYKPKNRKKGVKYYYYWGPDDQKTREFCHKMLSLDKVWSEDDIAIVSIELGYDVIKYKGSYNCRHTWRSFTGNPLPTPPPTINQIRKLIDAGIPQK